MIRKPIRILAINPGTRYFGIAIFRGADLRDWGVKVIEGKWSKEKVSKINRIILNLINEHEPDIFAIKKLNPCRSSSNLKRLSIKIKNLARVRGLVVYQYTLDDLEAFFSPKGKISKKKMAEMVTKAYPDLCHELRKENSNRNSYYIRMFEAVALGLVCSCRLDRN